MIDVPTRVKDALREGRRLKNYKFNVYKEVTEDVYSVLKTFSSESLSYHLGIENRQFFLYSPDNPKAFDYASVEIDGGGISMIRCPEPVSGQTETNVPFTGTKRTITIYGLADGATLVLRFLSGQSTEEVLDFTIDNDTLVSESVKIDERMCSDDTIKFGLCEGSSLEFQYFDHPNIRNRRIQAFIDVQYVNDDEELDWYEIPMGYFTVNECSLQYSTGIQKVVCYNKLMSKYLDAKANVFLDESYSSGDVEITMFDIMHTLLKGYSIEPDYNKLAPSYPSPSRPGELVVLPFYEYEGTLEFRFNQNYGIDNPFNYYMWRDAGAGATNTGHLVVESECVDFSTELNVQKYAFLNYLKGNYEELEYAIYNYLVNTLNAANLTKTGEEILENFLSLGLWPKFCGLAYTHENTSSPIIGTVRDYYSTIQYKYDIAHNVTNCAGPAKDFLNKIFPIKRTMSMIVDSAISIIMPLAYGMVRVSGSTFNSFYYQIDPVFGLDVHLTGTFYNYYTDSTLTTTAETELERIKINDTDEFIMNSVYQDWPLYFEPISYTELNDAELVTVKISDMPDFTLRDIATAIFETQCQYGQLDRITDLFGAVELNFDTLFPSETLYPDDDLYPQGRSERTVKSWYSKLWTDTEGGQSFRYLIITYKGYDAEEDKEVEYTLQRTVNANGTTDYNMSDNWLFRNLIWTAEEVGNYADAMAAKMRDITWFPFEMWCAGLPYVETGDKIEVVTRDGDTQASYVLQRQLDGIQNLQDTYINGTLDVF